MAAAVAVAIVAAEGVTTAVAATAVTAVIMAVAAAAAEAAAVGGGVAAVAAAAAEALGAYAAAVGSCAFNVDRAARKQHAGRRQLGRPSVFSMRRGASERGHDGEVLRCGGHRSRLHLA
jgi:hypothetical protein